MKILGEKNNELYIQLMDIEYMNKKNMDIPLNVKQLFNKYNNMYKYNKYDFIKISEEEIIKYIQSLDFILDYNEYINMDYQSIKYKVQEIYDEMGKILDYYSSLSIDEKKMNLKLRKEYYNKEHMIESIAVIYKIQQHIIKVNTKDIKLKLLTLN